MNEVVLLLKIFLYGVLGYYLRRFLEPKQKSLEGFYSIFYLLFSLISLASPTGHLLYLFILGVLWSIIVKLFLNTIDRRLSWQINPLWFGGLNILNIYVINAIFEFLIFTSEPSSVVFLLITGVLACLIDFTRTLRDVI